MLIITNMKYFLNAILIIGLLNCFFPVKAQQSSDIIVGSVYAKGEGGLIGVSIQELDATNRVVSGTVTDINGDFSLQIKNPKNKLEFIYLGYNTLRVNIGNQKKFSIQMTEDTKSLSEVVVTAKKKVSTGTLSIPEREASMAFQTIKADFQTLSVASVDEALQGQIAGLDIISNSGDVGSGSTMRLRGTASINANVTPLIVVDDVIYDAPNADTFDFVNANTENYADLLSINVDDIENITVLKDGASTARWGSRAANGVISIRKKRGVRGRPQLRYTYRLSEKWQPRGMRMLNGDEYTMLMKEAYFNPLQSDAAANIKEFNYVTNDGVFPDWRMYDNNTDWVGAVETRGITNDHYLTLSGGGERATFYISGGYYNETGSIIGQNLDRYTSLMNLSYYVSDRIVFSSDMSFAYSNQDKNYNTKIDDKDYDLLALAYRKMPNLGIYREDANGNSTGEYYSLPQNISSSLKDQLALPNPVALANLAKNNVKNYRLLPIFRLSYDLIPSNDDQMLQLRAMVQFDINNSTSYAFLPKEVTSAAWTDKNINKADNGNSKSYQTTSKIELEWHPKFTNKNHALGMTILGEMTSGTSAAQSESSYGMPAGIASPTTGSFVSDMKSSTNYWRSMDFVYTAHYSYMSKYNLDFTYTREGSSRFGPDKRFGNFGGISGRWNISDEEFMKRYQKWLSMLAIRSSTGIVGNQPDDDYLYFSKYSSWSNYLGSGTIRPDAISLNTLQWETTRDVNIGANIGLFDDLFTADFNFYNKITSNLLQKDVKIPTSSGFPKYAWQNVGSVQNRGWELFLNLNHFINVGKFHADFNLNFANNRNTVLSLSDIVLAQYNGDYTFKNGDYLSRLQLHNSLGSIYGFRYKGVYQYSADNPNLVASGYTLGSAPIARNADGSIIYDSDGKPVPMYFAYGTTNQYKFQGGDAIYEDVNHDGNINELDIVYLGNSYPKINGGGGFKFTYDKFSVNIYSVFRYGNKIVNAARMYAESMLTNDNQSRAVNWRWRKEGDLTDMPRAWNQNAVSGTTLPVARNFLGSDRYVEDGSFLRINQISFNYVFPKRWLSRLAVSNASFFLTLYNVYCFTKYSGVDPEVSYDSWGVSTDNSQTPRTQSFTGGVALQF